MLQKDTIIHFTLKCAQLRVSVNVLGGLEGEVSQTAFKLIFLKVHLGQLELTHKKTMGIGILLLVNFQK